MILIRKTWLRLKMAVWNLMKIPCLLVVQKEFGGIGSLTFEEDEEVRNHCAFELSPSQIVEIIRGKRNLVALRKRLEELGYSKDDIYQIVNNYRADIMKGKSVENVVDKIRQAGNGLNNS